MFYNYCSVDSLRVHNDPPSATISGSFLFLFSSVFSCSTTRVSLVFQSRCRGTPSVRILNVLFQLLWSSSKLYFPPDGLPPFHLSTLFVLPSRIFLYPVLVLNVIWCLKNFPKLRFSFRAIFTSGQLTRVLAFHRFFFSSSPVL